MIAAGNHQGTIVIAELRKSQKDGGAPYFYLKFKVGQSDTVDFYGSLSTKTIETGKRQGQRVGDITCETMVALGWSGEWDSVQELVGVESSIVVAHEPDDQGNMRAKVKFVNPSTGTPPDAGDVAALKAQFRATVVAAKQKRPAHSAPPRHAAAPPAKAKSAVPPDDDYGPTYDDAF